uniref:KxYKxGKxW signal peptide domain-containing protein n=1 Tax=Limosilactobacillus reuteri TaxID=1598 RepID=UPI003D80DD5E
MHKKLYKAKKNWVISIVAGSILMFGCVVGANADDQLDTQNNANTSTSPVAQNIEQVANENDSLAKSNSANNQAITTETQTNNSNNTQVNTSIQDEFPNKATIFGNGGGSYSDISPSNTAKLVNNSKREGVISDDDPTLLVPAYRSHFDKHIAPHETLFSKNINRRGQHYVIGMASEGENATFLNYVQNGDTLAIACGTGISKNPYTLAGQYYGASFSGGANIEWNAHHAISFGQARTNNDNKIETTLDANMQNNGVMNYTISWKNDSNKEFDYFGSSVYPKDQPFSFDIGNLEGYSSEPEFLLSPIWQISDDIYFNYALTDKYTDNPQYTLQFIKVDKNSTKVMSSLDSSWASVYDSGFDVPGKSIPGLPVFVPENAKSYPSGIVVYPPIDGRKIKDEHQGTGIVALDNKTPERTIKFQRVFMNAKELSGLTSEEILPYVYGLFNSNNGNSNSQVAQKVQLIFRDIATHKPVLSKEVLCKTPYLNFGINGLDLSKTLLYLGEDGKIYLNDKKHNLLFRVVNPSQYKKISITSPKLQDILVEPVVDLDKEDTDFVLTETGLDVATFNDIKDFAKKTAKAFNLFNQGKKVKDAVDKDSDKKWYGLDGEEDEMQSEARKKDQSSGIKVISVLGKSNKLFVDANTTNSDVKDKNILKDINDWSNNLNDVKDLGLELIKDLDVLTKPLTSLATRLNGKSRNKIYNGVTRWTSISDSKGFKLFSQFNEKADPTITVGLGSMDLFQSISTAKKDMGNDKHVSQQSPSNRVKKFKKVRKDDLTVTEKAVTLVGGIISWVAAATGVGIPLATAITAVLSVGGAAILAVLLWRLLSAISTSKYTDKKLLAKFKVSKKK